MIEPFSQPYSSTQHAGQLQGFLKSARFGNADICGVAKQRHFGILAAVHYSCDLLVRRRGNLGVPGGRTE
jgi:hypothetical protein